MEPLLQISHLTKIFSDGKEDEYKAVDDVSFELFPGEKLAIIGESGSGKTTVVNMITRILDSTDGKILLDGEDITHYKRNKMKNIYRKMQMVFQTPTESFMQNKENDRPGEAEQKLIAAAASYLGKQMEL